MTLLHDFSHALDSHALDSHNHHAPCAVCRLIPQSASAAFSTEFAVRAVAVFESVGEIQTETVAPSSQFSFAAAIPRGPPLLLLV